jgi:hypothetical protein
MKQAIRENRQGKVHVAEYLLLDDTPEAALLRSRMEVYEETHDLYTRAVWFVGYSPEFDAVEMGAQPPEYDAIFTRHNSLTALELIFLRRDLAHEERLLKDLKTVSGDWLRRILGG